MFCSPSFIVKQPTQVVDLRGLRIQSFLSLYGNAWWKSTSVIGRWSSNYPRNHWIPRNVTRQSSNGLRHKHVSNLYHGHWSLHLCCNHGRLPSMPSLLPPNLPPSSLSSPVIWCQDQLLQTFLSLLVTIGQLNNQIGHIQWMLSDDTQLLLRGIPPLIVVVASNSMVSACQTLLLKDDK